MREQRPRSLAFAVVLVITALLSHQLALSTTNCLLVSSSLLQTPTQDLPVALLDVANEEKPKAGQSQQLTIRDLIETQIETSCSSEEMVLVNDRLLDPNNAFEQAINGTQQILQIPKIVHVTTKSRCLPKVFADNLQLWKNSLPDHSFILHNDAAMDRLLFDANNSEWQSLFPHVRLILRHCSISVAAKADLWRALVLWVYGGIYTDIDNAPGPLFNKTSIHPTDQAWFVVEEGGFLSQYFMASAPKHPLFFLLIQSTLHRLLDLNDVDHQYVPYVTGPGALKQAFMHFRHLQGPNKASKQSKNSTYIGMVRSGHYVGLGNSTVTVVGRRSQSNDFVARNVVYKKRHIYQKLMNMTHFSRIHSTKEARAALNTDSCLERLWKREAASINRRNWSMTAHGKRDDVRLFW